MKHYPMDYWPTHTLDGGSATRTLDVIVSTAVLVAIAPLMLIVAALVFLQDGGPVFFAHERVGLNGKRFRCLKFRSMAVDAEARLRELLARDPVAKAEWDASHKLRRDPRVTPLGNFLRRSSMDEFPQLLNVLRGEMSLVGPRPIVDSEIVRYGSSFADYCAVRPGVTGPWQISGRSDVSYAERVDMDANYARSKSLALDLKILALTVPAVLMQRGSY